MGLPQTAGGRQREVESGSSFDLAAAVMRYVGEREKTTIT